MVNCENTCEICPVRDYLRGGAPCVMKSIHNHEAFCRDFTAITPTDLGGIAAKDRAASDITTASFRRAEANSMAGTSFAADADSIASQAFQTAEQSIQALYLHLDSPTVQEQVPAQAPAQVAPYDPVAAGYEIYAPDSPPVPAQTAPYDPIAAYYEIRALVGSGAISSVDEDGNIGNASGRTLPSEAKSFIDRFEESNRLFNGFMLAATVLFVVATALAAAAAARSGNYRKIQFKAVQERVEDYVAKLPQTTEHEGDFTINIGQSDTNGDGGVFQGAARLYSAPPYFSNADPSAATASSPGNFIAHIPNGRYPADNTRLTLVEAPPDQPRLAITGLPAEKVIEWLEDLDDKEKGQPNIYFNGSIKKCIRMLKADGGTVWFINDDVSVEEAA